MPTKFDLNNISSIAYQGMGMAMLAGISMRTMDMMERNMYRRTQRRARRKVRRKQRVNNWKYNYWND